MHNDVKISIPTRLKIEVFFYAMMEEPNRSNLKGFSFDWLELNRATVGDFYPYICGEARLLTPGNEDVSFKYSDLDMVDSLKGGLYHRHNMII